MLFNWVTQCPQYYVLTAHQFDCLWSYITDRLQNEGESCMKQKETTSNDSQEVKKTTQTHNTLYCYKSFCLSVCISVCMSVCNTLYCYKSFRRPLTIFESPIFFLLSLALELVEASCGGDRTRDGDGVSCKTCCDSLLHLILLLELNVTDDSQVADDSWVADDSAATHDSPVERLIAESANDDGTVTERLLCSSELRWSRSDLWQCALSSNVGPADTVVKLQQIQTTVFLSSLRFFLLCVFEIDIDILTLPLNDFL